MKKRFLALLLTFCLVLSLCSVTAFAEGENNSLPEANNGVITLTSDVSISSLANLFTSGVSTDDSSKITIDLAGHTLTLNASSSLTLTDNQSLSFVDNTATGSATENTLKAGTLKLTGLTSTKSFFNPEAGASVSASNINVESTGSVFFPKGNAASVTVENCNVKTTGVYCVGTNAGSTDNYGVIITLKDSVLTADASDNDDCAVMINVDGTLDIDNCVITGDRQAVVVRAGAATIDDSTLIVTGAWIDAQTDDKDSRVTSAWSSGNEVASSALTVGNYVNGAATSYAKNATVTLTDTTVTSQALAPAIYVDANQSYSGTLTISGDNTVVTGSVTTGQYSSSEDSATQATISITGGTFSSDVGDYLDDTLIAVEQEDGTYFIETLGEKNAVACITKDGGTVYYKTLAEAVEAATDGGTVTLLKDVDLTATQEITSDVTINLNGKTIKGNNVRVFQVKSGTLTLTGEGTVTTEASTGDDAIADSSSVIRVGDSNADGDNDAAGLVIDSDVTIEAPATYGVTVFGKNSGLTLNVKGTVAATGTASAISGNGSSGLTATTITIEDGAVVTATGSAAIYQPQAGTLTIEAGATVTSSDGAGIVARSGSIVIEGGTISGGGTGNFTVGDSEVEVPKSAVVYDSSAGYPGVSETSAKLTISGGSFTAAEGVAAVSAVTTDGSEDSKISITNGKFSTSVSEYVDSSIKAELISSNDTDTPYSYYESVEDAKEAAQPGDLIVDLSESGQGFQILGVGFDATAKGANAAMTTIIANLGGSKEVTDSDVNTMWAFLKLSDTATTYTLTVNKDTDTVYTEKLKDASGLYCVYFTFNTENGGSPAKQEIASGTYTVTLTTGTDEDVKIDSAEITLAKVSYDLNGGTLADLPEDTYYTGGTEITLAAEPFRSGYTFDGWYVNRTSGTRAGDAAASYTVPDEAVTLMAKWTYNGGGSGGGTTTYSISVPSVSNGSVTASPTSASKGTTVTLTVSPDDGYELSSLTVTDASGNVLTLTDKGDGKYTFTMPASKVTVSATFTEIESEHDCPSKIFTDVDITQYYHEAVDWAVLNGVTNGTSATTFSPDASCTRAQMVTFLWRAAGCPAPTGATTPFTDVESGAYYYDAVLWAVEKGITNGTSATTFSPDETVTRGQTVTFLYRYAGSPAVSGSNNFTDVPTDAYYADAVQWAVANEVTNGTSTTTFEPESNCTRAQIVTFLYRDLTE